VTLQTEPARRAEVLVVEDDSETREALADFLRCEGYQSVGAADGSEALSYLRNAPPPGVILLDLSMPIMNGFEFRAQQLEDPRLAGIPVVVLTAGGLAAQAPRGLAVLTKPVDIMRLLRLVERHCAPRPTVDGTTEGGERNAPLPRRGR
jgi:CheY-like chemotaxis protein